MRFSSFTASLSVLFLVLILAAGGHGQSGACTAIDFDVPESFAAGSNANTFITADINGDTVPDIVVPSGVHYNEGSFSILFGDGEGGYGPPQTTATTTGLYRIAAGDVNGDGAIDLVGGTSANTLMVWLNDGTGGTAGISYVTIAANSQSIADLKLGDMNGDGRSDVVLLAEPRLYVLAGDGSGGFSQMSSMNRTGSSRNGWIVVGRFNSDNLADIAIAGGDNAPWYVEIIPGTQGGQLSVAHRYDLVGRPFMMQSGDINGDGLLDLFVAGINFYQPPTTSDPYFVQIWTGRGDGSFAAGTRIPFARPPTGAAVADLNGDGILDIAVDMGFAVAIRYGISPSVFGPAVEFMAPGSNGLIATDTNGDSRQDLLLLRTAPSAFVSVMLGTAEGFRAPKVKPPGGKFVVAGDLNNDGRADMVNTDVNPFGNPSKISVALALADGEPGPDQLIAGLPGLRSIDLGDFDGDGKTDIVTANRFNMPNRLGLHLGMGNGEFLPVAGVPWPTGVTQVVAADFNNDGRDDLVIFDDTPRAAVLINRGNASFEMVHVFPSGHSDWVTPKAGDFNSDGTPDLALARSGRLEIWLGLGDGNFTPGGTYSPAGGSFGELAVGDLNGDGKLDVVSLASGKVVRYFGDGSGGIADAQVQEFQIGSPHSLMTADFNRDGLDDIAFGMETLGGNIVVLPSVIEAPYFGEMPRLSIGAVAASGLAPTLAAGDFNGDGRPDITYTTWVSRGVVFNSTGTKPCISADEVTITEPDTGTVNAVFTLRLSAASNVPVRVNYSTVAGTAQLGTDLQNTYGRLQFAPGQTTATVTVPIIGDLLDEPDEQFVLRLDGVVGATIARANVIGTIVDNDPEPTLTVSDASVIESYNSPGLAFNFTLSAPSNRPISFRLRTADGTATGGTDYFATEFVVTMPPGTTTATHRVFIAADEMFEPDETMIVTLSEPVNIGLPDTEAIGTILNDDPVPTIRGGTTFIPEGNSDIRDQQIPIQLSNPSYLPVTARIVTVSGTAISGQDFAPGDVSVTIAPGQLSSVANIGIIGDTLDEPNETFSLDILNATNVSAGPTRFQYLILDDDPATNIAPENAAVMEGTGGTAVVNVPVRLAGPSGYEVRVNYATADVTATSPEDYTPASGTLVFAPGETVKTVPITIASDQLDEPHETFRVVLSAPANATLQQPTATVTIFNDDGPPITITGRVFTPGGTSLRNAVVTLILPDASRRTATTSSFGVYSFEGLSAGAPYTLTVSSKRYRFGPRTVTPAGSVADIDFVGLE